MLLYGIMSSEYNFQHIKITYRNIAQGVIHEPDARNMLKVGIRLTPTTDDLQKLASASSPDGEGLSYFLVASPLQLQCQPW